jgi:azurin
MTFTRRLSLLSIAFLGVTATAAAQSAVRTIEIQVGDNMKFSPAAIEAKAGERLHIVLKSTGAMPKAGMGHNFILLKKGTNPKAFVDKCANARASDFIPAEVKDQILAATGLVGPGETSEATFTAPASGDYDFVCTFPGHFNLGMRGKLTVK